MFKAKWLCFLLVMVFAPVIWGGQISPFLEDYLQGFTTSDDVKVLVMFEEQADIQSLNLQLKQERATLADRNRRVIEALQEVASRTQPVMVTYFDQLQGQGLINDYRTLWIANMAIVEATKAGVYAMADHGDIGEIYLSYEIEGIKPTEVSEDSDPPIIASHEIGLDRINAPAAWAAGFTGAGRVVANMDTGVDGNHPALADRFRGDVDNDGDVDESWFDPYTTNWPYPQDSGSHGTHTLGTICGRSATDTVGVAIDAQWISAAPIDRGGGIPRTVADAILSFQWFVDPDDNPNTQDNPDAVGNSWGVTTGHGYPPCDDTFWAVIDNLEAAGTAVVFSAGNEGSSPNTLRRPADRATTDYNVFSVGAVDGASPSLPIASFSSRGPSYCTPDGQATFKPEVVAPGVSVRSSVPGGGYSTMSGTSMASPHITGAVGVIRGVNPDLDVDSIKEILMATANDLGPEGEDNAYGVGIIDLYEACLVAMQGYGFVEGHVNDEFESPIGNALVSVDGTTRSVRADEAGYYSIGLPADTSYTMTASYFGYVSQSAEVDVVPDSTATQDFYLPEADYGVLHGHVTDLDSNPIENASISIIDTPLDPVLTDNDGYYIMDNIPGGADYTVGVAAVGYGYASADVFIPVNDTAQVDFSLQEMESFEGSNGGWSGEGVWEWGEPTSGPGSAYDGNNVWATVLGGSYPNNADDGLYTALYEITDPGAVLSFYHWYNMENNWDGGNIHVSTDNGYTWMLVTPDGGYPNPDVVGLDNEPGFSDQTSGWEQVIVDMSAFYEETIKIKFRFGSDGSVIRDGWYIDGVVLNGGTIVAPEANVSESSFYVELSSGENVTHSMTLSNTGDATLEFDVTVLTEALNSNSSPDEPVMDDVYPNTKEGYTITERGEIKLEVDPPSSGGVITRTGGPDEFGYTFIDSDEDGGPVYEWIDITGVGTPVTFNGYNPADDGYSDPIPMGMTFEFYGLPYTDVQVSTNGWVSFNVYTTSYLSNYSIPNSNNPNALIAVQWDDLDGGTPGICYTYYDEDENRFIVSWVDWAYYPDASTPVHSFQVILDGDDNSIVMQYGDIAGNYQDDITIGIEDQDGEVGLEYCYNNFAPYTGLAIRFNYPLFWLTVDPMFGSVEPAQSLDMDVTFDAAELADGDYFGEIRILTNDPNHSLFSIPCTLRVGQVGVDDNNAMPAVFTLDQNYPNPFNPITGIAFGVPVNGHVTLEVYDIMGRKVNTLVDEDLIAGRHNVIWDGTNADGAQVTSGVYFYKLTQGENTTTKKMIMLK